ncbi:MAG: helix-turn-helix transcriptional regulator [Lachnospiraceae bacterium]|nr:helix-turn-helix transcriptional regulator [Lachnospiraceae bacterium]
MLFFFTTNGGSTLNRQPINRILLNLRENHNLKQKDVANMLGISQQTYSNYELGKRELPLHHMIPLAEFYNISLDELFELKIRSDREKSSEEFANGVTMKHLIYDLTLLSPSQKSELLAYLAYLKQRNP